MAQVIDDHFGRPEDLCAPAVATLQDFQDGLVRLGRIMAKGNGLLLAQVKRLADTFLALNAMLTQQLTQL